MELPIAWIPVEIILFWLWKFAKQFVFREYILYYEFFLIERIFISRLAIQLYCVSNHLMRFGHKIEEKNTNKWNKNNKL